jgi:hypothetical protein
MIIKNGRVALDFFDEYKKTDISDGVHYTYEIMDYTYTNGSATYAITTNKKSANYVMVSINGDTITLAAPEGSSTDTFSGVYKKTSIAIPKEK